ncbi:hypothetical protein D9M71_728660 [compost metagenome]
MVVLEQHDFRQALLMNQLGRHALKHQRKETQTRGEPGGQAGLDHGAATEELQAAGFELARIHAKKLVIPPPGQQAPQTRISAGRNTGVTAAEQGWIDADLVQHLIGGRARVATLQQRFAHQLHGNGVFFRHCARRALFWFEVVGILTQPPAWRRSL